MESPDDGDVDDNKHNNNNSNSNNNNNNNNDNNNNNNNNSYNESVKTFIEYKMSSDPGYFAKGLEQRHYELCQVCPLRRQRQEEEEEEEEEIEQIKNTSSLAVGVPILVLPLRINLIRSTILGCSQSLNINSIKSIVDQINNMYWIKQAGIQFNLIDVKERYCTLGPTIENDIQHFITHQLKRGTDGKMMYKKERRHKFCNVLLSSFLDNSDSNSSNNNSKKNNRNNLLETTSNIYDIWFIDMVGQQSQGQCIDRTSRTVIMGERSTKGYNEPTKRPHDCIAKTAAHELGHALLLNHPQKGMKFEDGRNQILSSSSSKSKSKYNNNDNSSNNSNSNSNSNSNKNLMSGGSDIKGGGGSYLEQWQCSIAREAAQIFLNKHR